MNKDKIDRLNELGSSGEPFLFVVDYKGDKAYINLKSATIIQYTIKGRFMSR